MHSAGRLLIFDRHRDPPAIIAVVEAGDLEPATEAEDKAAVEAESRERLRRFLERPTGYQPGNAQMFHD